MKNLNRYLLTLSFLAFTIGLFAKVKPESLKCEYLTNPEGIDMQAPRFFWKLTSIEVAQYQTAYQILVATSQEKLDKNIGDVFDSKKVSDSRSIQIEYKGKKLEPASHYFWKVKVWGKTKEASEWSETAKFSLDFFQ